MRDFASDTLPSLRLAYGPLPPAKLAALERVARAQGLPLAALEQLGRDEAACDDFLAEAAAARPRRPTRLRLPPALRPSP